MRSAYWSVAGCRRLSVLFVLVLAGCGGGSSSSPPADTTPSTFSFSAVADAAYNSDVVSGAVVVQGISAAAPIAIVGGEYSINGDPFTASAGTVTNGQSVTVRVRTPATELTAADATLTIGGVSATFTVTTAAADPVPDSFTLHRSATRPEARRSYRPASSSAASTSERTSRSRAASTR